MPGVAIHILFPFLLFLALRALGAPIDVRKVLWLWPLTLATDLDHLVGGLPRAMTENLFTLAPALGVAAVGHWSPKQRGLREWGLIAAAYIAAHLLMDMFTGGIAAFWPVSDFTVCWLFAIDASFSSKALTWYWQPCSHAGTPVPSEIYPFLDTDQASMLVLTALFWIGFAAWRVASRLRAGSRA
ncbi:MAG: hypothetical protein ACYDCK_06950 [Thermoplasmatota archaeon]